MPSASKIRNRQWWLDVEPQRTVFFVDIEEQVVDGNATLKVTSTQSTGPSEHIDRAQMWVPQWGCLRREGPSLHMESDAVDVADGREDGTRRTWRRMFEADEASFPQVVLTLKDCSKELFDNADWYQSRHDEGWTFGDRPNLVWPGWGHNPWKSLRFAGEEDDLSVVIPARRGNPNGKQRRLDVDVEPWASLPLLQADGAGGVAVIRGEFDLSRLAPGQVSHIAASPEDRFVVYPTRIGYHRVGRHGDWAKIGEDPTRETGIPFDRFHPDLVRNRFDTLAEAAGFLRTVASVLADWAEALADRDGFDVEVVADPNRRPICS